MVTVPQYQREVKPEVTPTPYNHLQVNGDMFGVNVAEANGKLGASIQNTLHTALDIKNRIDETKMLEIYNAETEWQQKNLYDKENGYFYKQGKDAYGKSKEVMESFDKDIQERVAKAGFTPANAARFNASIARMRERVSAQVNAHDFQQGVKWSTAEAGLAMQNAITSGVNARNNDEEVATHLATGLQSIEWQGEIQHKDKAQIEADKKEYISQFHEAVLSSYLAENALKASQYLEKHKSEIRPDRLPSYIDAVGDNELLYTARTTAQGLVGLSLEQAYEKINAIQNPKERNAVEREYSRLTSQQEAIQREKNAEAMDRITQQLENVVDNGGDVNQLKKDVMKTDMDLDDKKRMIDYINTIVDVGQEVNLWNITESLDNMALYDNENFRKLDLARFPLSKSERQKYLEMQKNPVEYTTEKELRKMANQFSGVNSIGKNSLDNNAYKEDITTMLAMIERKQGKAFDINHIDKDYIYQNLKAGFEYKDNEQKNKNIDETKELYLRAIEGLKKTYNTDKARAMVQQRVVQDYMLFKKANKREPDVKEMYEMVKKTYNDVGRGMKELSQQKVQKVNNVAKGVYNTKVTKKGYTKELTYFENIVIPQMEKETGVKMKVTSTYRDAAKNQSVGGTKNSLHLKGMAIDIFPEYPTKDNIQKTTEYLLSHPIVGGIFCNNPNVERYRGNKKLQYTQAVDYQKRTGITHTNHYHITLNHI